MKYAVSNITPATWQDKKYFKATLTNEAGETFENIAFWNGEVGENSTEIEGDLTKNDKGYWKFQGARQESGRKPNMERVMDKKATNIAEAQQRKNDSIKDAQDRSAWMWAKYSAAQLVANNVFGSLLDDKDKVLETVNDVATKIYNMEPLTPFN